MRSAIDSAGRVVIPKALRVRATLRPGTPVEIRYSDGAIVIEPAPAPVRIVKRGRFVVAEPRAAQPALGTSEVEATRERLRRERGGGDE